MTTANQGSIFTCTPGSLPLQRAKKYAPDAGNAASGAANANAGYSEELPPANHAPVNCRTVPRPADLE